MICQKSGKQIHLSIKKAQKHLAGVRRRIGKYEGEVYKCPYCPGWHIGRTKNKVKKNKYAKSSRLYN